MKVGAEDEDSPETRCVQTRSPTLNDFTWDPTAVTVPDPSEQGVTPGLKNGSWGSP